MDKYGKLANTTKCIENPTNEEFMSTFNQINDDYSQKNEKVENDTITVEYFTFKYFNSFNSFNKKED